MSHTFEELGRAPRPGGGEGDQRIRCRVVIHQAGSYDVEADVYSSAVIVGAGHITDPTIRRIVDKIVKDSLRRAESAAADLPQHRAAIASHHGCPSSWERTDLVRDSGREIEVHVLAIQGHPRGVSRCYAWRDSSGGLRLALHEGTVDSPLAAVCA